MLRIGDFARLGGVSVTTLRHYDDIGLLAPDTVDAETGYRYYGVGQLARLNRIVALKDLGFSLEQVGRVLEGVTPDELRGMLTMKAAEVERQLAGEQERLARIEARIKQIELEEHVPDYDVILKDAPALLIASRKVTIPTNDQVPEVLGAAFGEVYDLLKARGAQAPGPCLAIWHQPAAVLEGEVAEAAAPADHMVAGTDRVDVYELPKTTVASVIHRGDFATFNLAHAVLLSWIEANGYRSNGTYREVYLQEGGGAAEAVTELQYPVER